jgi:hypothetical protein
MFRFQLYTFNSILMALSRNKIFVLTYYSSSIALYANTFHTILTKIIFMLLIF